jgi:CBS domain-containing protein
MLRLRDIMTTDVLSVSPETSVRNAMEVLAHYHVSGVPVIANHELVGVVTSTDLLMFASALPGVPTQRDIDEPWSDTGLTIAEDAEREREPTSAFFADLWDDAGADVAERIEKVDGPEWNALEEHDVSEVMTRSPLVTLGPDADVTVAAALMSDRGIHRVLVTESDRLVGIVTALDIAAAVSRHMRAPETYVFNRDRDFHEPDFDPRS